MQNAQLAPVCLDCALICTLLVMMRDKERGRWEIAANHNVRLPGALTGKRRRETSLDSKATQLLRANDAASGQARRIERAQATSA